MNRLNLLEGVAVGASVAYLLDPDRGPIRRRRLAARVGAGARAAVGVATTRLDQQATGEGRMRRVIASLRAPSRTREIILRRARRHPVSEWDIPMATVDIDVDQGIVTLRGVFPTVDQPQVRAWPHRGFTRAPIHLVEDLVEEAVETRRQ